MARILLVDDDPDIRFVARIALRKGKHEVIEAENGLVAIDWLARGERCDLVICDRMMPVMNGMEVLEALRGHPTVEAGRFVFLTAKAQAAEIEEGLKMGAAAYLTKPFEPKDLLAYVDRLLGGAEEAR